MTPFTPGGKARDIPVILPLFCFADTHACGRTTEGPSVDAGVEWPPLLWGKARDMPVILPWFCFADTQACGRTKEGPSVDAGV